MKQPITFAICGFGNRGRDAYAAYQKQHPDQMKIVAVAEPVPERLMAARTEYGVEEAMCFENAETLLKQPKLADVMIIATQDRQHIGHALPALELGYHLLLEKPISPELKECVALLDKAHETGRLVVVCHVLRYTAFFSTLKELIEQGAVGTVQTLDAVENVAYYHHAHSFVRGNWRNSAESCPMILAKSCHDMDMIRYLMGEPCVRVSSFGRLGHFRRENAPAGSAGRCLDCGVRDACPYDAEKIYLTNPQTGLLNGNVKWPVSVLAHDPTEGKVRQALREGPYGRCVYHCDNDVVDHQVVSMEFESGATATFTMSAFTQKCYRTVRVMGSMGELEGDMDLNRITVRRFGQADQVIDLAAAQGMSGHGGGDEGIMASLCELVKRNETAALSSIDASVESHVMALAAEHSRLNGGQSVELEAFARSAAR